MKPRQAGFGVLSACTLKLPRPSAVLIQCIMNGAYVDPSDVKKSFVHEHWIKNVLSYTERYGIM